MSQFDISIIIPLYNREGLIKRCLDAIASQSLSQDQYEVLVIDDCSTDNSFEVVKSYRKIKNLVVTSLSTNSGGASKPRNRGIDIARGRYIVFIDSDDIISENALKLALDLALKGDLDMVVIPVMFGPERGSYTSLFDKYPNGIEKAYFSKNRELGSLVFSNPGIIGRLYRSQLLQKTGIRFSERMRIYEDTLFSRFIFSVCETFGMVSIKKAHYYPEPAKDSTNLSLTKRTIDSCLPYLLEAIRICDEISNDIISYSKKLRIINNSFCRNNIYKILNKPEGYKALVPHLHLLLPYLYEKDVREKAKGLIQKVCLEASHQSAILLATQYFKQYQQWDSIAGYFEKAWIWQNNTLVLDFKIDGYRFGIDIFSEQNGHQLVELVLRREAQQLAIDWSFLGRKNGHRIMLFYHLAHKGLESIFGRILGLLDVLRKQLKIS